MRRVREYWPITLAIAAGLLFTLLVVRQFARPLMYDDANFALAAKAVAETGLPFGNQGWMSERGDFSQREQWALWHPPLYVYLLGAAAKLGGWTPIALRSLGLLGGLASGVLAYMLAHDLTRGSPQTRRLAGAAAAALTLFCPLVVQSALVLDIDLTLLLPLTLLFLILSVRLEATRRQWLWLAPLFALMLWAKMTNPVPVVLVVVVWQALRGQFGRAALHFVGIGLGGAAIFGLTWLAIGRWLGFPLDMPFAVNLVQWQDSADVARRAYTSPGAFIEGLQPTVLWLGPGLVGAGLVGIGWRVGQLLRQVRFRGTDLLIGVLIVFVLGYVAKSAGWLPKYQVALVPLLACLAAPLVARAWSAFPRLTTIALTVSAAATAVVHARVVRDDWAMQRSWALEDTATTWLLVIVVIAMALGSLWRAAGVAAFAAIVGLSMGWSVTADFEQLLAPYATSYWYGTSGTREAAAWLDAHLAPADTYVAAKEVAILARNQRYVDQDNLVYFLSTGRGFGDTWAGEPIRAFVLWQREPYGADLFTRSLPGLGFRETARFGDYVIYEQSGH